MVSHGCPMLYIYIGPRGESSTNRQATEKRAVAAAASQGAEGVLRPGPFTDDRNHKGARQP